ncbi:MAG: hypothetical protein K9J25_09010 [Bacteroidales bacterium]|nr:hypothetical protein [Bacteroidales bacterium]
MKRVCSLLILLFVLGAGGDELSAQSANIFQKWKAKRIEKKNRERHLEIQSQEVKERIERDKKERKLREKERRKAERKATRRARKKYKKK